MADRSRGMARIDVLARQVGSRLLREGSMFAGNLFDAAAQQKDRGSNLSTYITTAHLPPPVSRQAMTRLIQLCLRALFPEFNRCREDDEAFHISPSSDIGDILLRIAAVLREQLMIAEHCESHERERERHSLEQRQRPPCAALQCVGGATQDQSSGSPDGKGPDTEHMKAQAAGGERVQLPFNPMTLWYASPIDVVIAEFFNRLPKLQVLLNTDVDAVLEKDVATSSRAEVVLAYPSVVMMTHHRIAHELHLLGVPSLMTRLISEIGHSLTGIDIHPHTQIGHHFFIDHGTGIVIGGTAVIGNFVSIYQGVTLGAKSFLTDPASGKRIKNLPRHPIVEDHVTLYANCCVLGRVRIGRYSTIGGNVFVTRDVPPGSTVVQGKAMVIAGPVGPLGGATGATADAALMQGGSGI